MVGHHRLPNGVSHDACVALVVLLQGECNMTNTLSEDIHLVICELSARLAVQQLRCAQLK